MIYIYDWSIVPIVFNLEEYMKMGHPVRLRGTVHNHPKFKPGTKITTSVITGVYENLFHTKSGSEYYLGGISKQFLAHMNCFFKKTSP